MKEVKRRVWVIEVETPLTKDWRATCCVRLTKNEALEEIADWRFANPCDKYRLVKYVPAEGGGK